jgi:hypothetical protein
MYARLRTGLPRGAPIRAPLLPGSPRASCAPPPHPPGAGRRPATALTDVCAGVPRLRLLSRRAQDLVGSRLLVERGQPPPNQISMGGFDLLKDGQ